MKRFYKSADIVADDSGFAVHLDGKPVKTPARRRLVLPNEALARAVAAEWSEQGEVVDPRSLRLTRVSNSAVDRVPEHRAAIVDEVGAFISTDLLCYRASGPAELARRQAAAWDPLLDWLRAERGIVLTLTDSLLPIPQPEESVRKGRQAVDEHDDFALSGLHMMTLASGSVVLGLAAAAGRIDGRAAWEASLVDESWQLEEWGEEVEATKRRAGLLTDMTAAGRFLDLCRAS